MINLMLEVEDDEDVSCAVEDMEAIGRSRSLVQRGWGDGGTRSEMMALSSGAGGARLCRPHEVSEAVMVKDY